MCAHVRILLFVALLMPLCGLALAQDDPPPLKAEELDALTAPIALYPDSLLSQVLMATTYPADVAAATEWSAAHKDDNGDAAVKMVEGEAWDPSVKSLVAFPAVLAMMKEQPDWVQQMGDAFLAQSKDVMDSVQRLRKQAKDAGNLKSTEQQVVKEEPSSTATTPTTAVQPSTTTSTSSSTTIVIEQSNPETIYVPSYNPSVVYGSWAYPSYPPYYFPPPPYYYGGAVAAGVIGFTAGVIVGDALWGDCNWGGGDVDIDINKYNNVNVGNKINSDNKKWNHNAANRDGVPYRDSGSREKYSQNRAGADQRSEYRGRDTASTGARDSQREAARSNLERQTGVNTRDAQGAADRASRDLANSGISQNDLGRAGNAGAGTRDVNSGSRSGGNLGSGGAGTRDVNSGSRSGGNLGGAGASTRDAGSVSRGGGGATTSNMSRSGGGSSAFSGAGSGGSHQSMSRGNSSAGGRSMSHGGGGGGGARGGGGGGGRRR